MENKNLSGFQKQEESFYKSEDFKNTIIEIIVEAHKKIEKERPKETKRKRSNLILWIIITLILFAVLEKFVLSFDALKDLIPKRS